MLVACKGDGAAPAGSPTKSESADSMPVPKRAERDASGKVFSCTIDSASGRNTCVATTFGCQRGPCEERAEAWCFPGIAARYADAGDVNSNCVVDRSSCETWSRTFADVGFIVKGPCALLRPGDTVSAVEAYLERH